MVVSATSVVIVVTAGMIGVVLNIAIKARDNGMIGVVLNIAIKARVISS